MNTYYVELVGHDEHGSKHRKSFTLKAKECNFTQLCEDFAKEKNLTDVSVERSRNMGPVAQNSSTEEKSEGEEDTTMATTKKTAKKTAKKKAKK